jgi:hypothetical protein
MRILGSYTPKEIWPAHAKGSPRLAFETWDPSILLQQQINTTALSIYYPYRDEQPYAKGTASAVPHVGRSDEGFSP